MNRLAEIKAVAQRLPARKQVELVYYLLAETDLTMKQIGELVGRSESGIYRLNVGERYQHASVEYPIRGSRQTGVPDKYFYPSQVLEYAVSLLPQEEEVK